MQIRLSGFDRKNLAAQIQSDIDAACVEHYGEGFRDHLGASTIGETCLRRLVYSFRHMHQEIFSGQQLRLFNRGHKEELRFVEWLRWIGATVAEFDTNGKQFRMEGFEKHYGGSFDGQLTLPERYQLPTRFLLEMKTHNENNFKKLLKYGMRQSKPMHYVQMCSYGEAGELRYGIYIAINKNDDNIYVEVIELDWDVGKKHRTKALSVIIATKLPPKVAASPLYDTCKYCPYSGICHSGNPVNVNCRSCANAIPEKDGAWHCNLWNALIPKEAIPTACNQWKAFE